jgi:hypothetical protein
MTANEQSGRTSWRALLARQRSWPYLLMTLGVFFLATDVIVGRLAEGRDPPWDWGFGALWGRQFC